jgi:hypothetical protein
MYFLLREVGKCDINQINNHFIFHSTNMIWNLGQNWDFQPCPCKSTMTMHWPTFNLFQFNHLIAFNICVNLFQFNYLIAFNICVQFANGVCLRPSNWVL